MCPIEAILDVIIPLVYVLTLYHTIPTFNNPGKETFLKHCNQHFLLFSQCCLLYLKTEIIILATFE